MFLNLRPDNENPITLTAYIRITSNMSVSSSFFYYSLFQKHSKHNVFKPLRTDAPAMFCIFRILALYVDITGINFNMNLSSERYSC